MAGKKKAAKKKGVKRKPLPHGALGTGLASKAGKKLGGRALKLKKAECSSMGGKWSGGKCT